MERCSSTSRSWSRSQPTLLRFGCTYQTTTEKLQPYIVNFVGAVWRVFNLKTSRDRNQNSVIMSHYSLSFRAEFRASELPEVKTP